MKKFTNFLLNSIIFLATFALASPATPQVVDAIGTRSSFNRCIDRSGGVTPTMRDCISHEFSYQKSRLDRTYNHLQASLGKTGQEQLRQTEQAWHATMMAYCDAGPEPGQGQELDAYSCALNETTKRAAILEHLEQHMKNSKASN
jgi:uncharacterized protein YecT (DUF1311 family)